jgi:hypothetical protein
MTFQLINNLATFLTAIAALVTAGGTLLTVRQMQKQMAASYRPELAFARMAVNCTSEGSPLPTHWTSGRDASGNGEEQQTGKVKHLSYNVNLYNIGLGAATNIKATWDFPVAEIAEKINKLAQQALVPAYYEYKNGILSFSSEGYGQIGMVWRNEKTRSLDYLLPQSTVGEGTPLMLPCTFIHLISSYLYFRLVNKNANDFSVPPLSVLLEYGDISGGQHSVAFGLQVKMKMLSVPTDSQPMMMEGYIEPRKRV